ncbi:MAG: class I SAM-dependent RNA methyltransferase [Magnetovibrio sp.]|nr:class I SAM-dependent RNA methyltransferase [Magnetovibrio sp.]
MNTQNNLEIFLVAVPGAEPLLCAEAAEKGFNNPKPDTGGVTVWGDWPEVWRANLELCGASRVLVRLGSFKVVHLAKLDKLARRFPWAETLRSDVSVRVEASCKKSRIYHSGAVTQRISTAITEELGASVSTDGAVAIKVRLQNDLCTISVDTSGEGLHKRDHKQAVNKAPMRETLASLMLRQCGFDGKEPVVDPMCGSGTFVIEAAEIATGLLPGRTRHFAFEQLATFDPEVWQQMQTKTSEQEAEAHFYGFDHDSGAIRMSRDNAERAGVAALTEFQLMPISDLKSPCETPGLVIVNPPYGARIGNIKKMKALYRSLGETMKAQFPGWRVGVVTNTESLAKATRLPFTQESEDISHGGLRVKVYSTDPL